VPDADTAPFPRSADLVVLGGGTSGAVVAGRVAERSDRSILVLEAGPDYGPFGAGSWPRGLLDARAIPQGSHSWRYASSARYGQRELPLERARVIGGCSSHNGCAAVWGHRDDYDGWQRLGNPGWGAEALLPLFRAANERMRVRTPALVELGAFHRAVLDAAPAAGLPITADLDDLDGGVGMSVSPINVWEGVRWNAAFAYLDPVRDRPNLTIRGNVLADRLVLERGRVTAVEVITPSGPARVEAGEVVVSAGAYGSPALLLRSGIGPADQLAALGIEPLHPLAGVGENLHDHPAMLQTYAGTPALRDALRGHMGRVTLREEGTIAKARSALCRRAFDLHIYPVASPYWNLPPGAWDAPGFDYAAQNYGGGADWLITIPVATLTPLARGSVRLASRDPQVAPVLDHGNLTDPQDRDLAVLLDGLEIARGLAAQPPLAELIGPQVGPPPELLDRAALQEHVRLSSVHYYHPVGTCRMSPASDPLAVVDAAGRVHGLEGLRVADCSIMPVVPRANTNIPAVVVGEKIAALMLESS
jgi:choline dehydrogenase